MRRRGHCLACCRTACGGTGLNGGPPAAVLQPSRPVGATPRVQPSCKLGKRLQNISEFLQYGTQGCPAGNVLEHQQLLKKVMRYYIRASLPAC